MQTQGPDHFTSAYGYYRGDDGYLYPIVLNEAEGTPQFPIVVSGVDDGQHFVSGVPFEPPQVQRLYSFSSGFRYKPTKTNNYAIF